MAIDNNQTVQQVNVQQLQAKLAENPLMNGSTPEILVDDNDSLHTVINGEWSKQTRGGYGPSWKLAKPAASPQSIVFTPEIKADGNYNIYTYTTVIDSAAKQTHYIINNNGKTKHVYVPAHKKVEGQTSGEWILLGEYELEKGNNASVTIITENTGGYVAADALLFVPFK